jgi:putative ABC transport system permease protein
MLTLKLAWRNLFRNVRRTVLTCTLISSALIVLILFDGMMLGMVDAMVGGITKTLSGEAQVHKKGFRENLAPEFYLQNPDEIAAALSGDERISAHASRVIVGGMIAIQ